MSFPEPLNVAVPCTQHAAQKSGYEPSGANLSGS